MPDVQTIYLTDELGKRPPNVGVTEEAPTLATTLVGNFLRIVGIEFGSVSPECYASNCHRACNTVRRHATRRPNVPGASSGKESVLRRRRGERKSLSMSVTSQCVLNTACRVSQGLAAAHAEVAVNEMRSIDLTLRRGATDVSERNRHRFDRRWKNCWLQ